MKGDWYFNMTNAYCQTTGPNTLINGLIFTQSGPRQLRQQIKLEMEVNVNAPGVIVQTETNHPMLTLENK